MGICITKEYNMSVKINIAKDFTETPGARFKKEGKFSGEEFRKQFLEKHFSNRDDNYTITIILDGVEGYATSFLEEAFGGLARSFSRNRVKSRLKFISNEDPLLIEEIQLNIENCDRSEK